MMRIVPLVFLATTITLGLLSLSACTTPGMRVSNANRLALPTFMYPRTITVDGYQIKTYERTHALGGVATVYIEGSGNVWGRGFDLANIMDDPTPQNPVGMVLASNDTGKNVIYVARPCQYGMKKVGADTCPADTLTTRMYAPDMVALYNHVLDGLKSRYRFTKFQLVGYESGGGLATLLASERDDVLSLRTVAGILDTETFARAKGLTGFEVSVNPVTRVPKLIDVPQHHYLAQFDDLVPNEIYHSFAQAFGNNRCLSYTLVPEVDHTYDWAETWAGAAKLAVTCMDTPITPLPLAPPL